MKHWFSCTFIAFAFFLTPSWAAVLENPGPFSSGASFVSGWKCTAGIITVRFDGGPPFEAVYGSPREDTRPSCGHANTGFLLLFNWNLLGDGIHLVEVFDDGTLFASTTTVVATFGTEFLSGENGTGTITFASGRQATVQWSERAQNFVIVRTDGNAIPRPTPTVRINKEILTDNPDVFLSWDVTGDVQDSVDGLVENNGWLIRDEQEDDGYTTSWVSKESSAAGVCGPDSSPRLRVVTDSGTVTVQPPEADTALDQNSPNMNRGANPIMQIVSWGIGNNQRILVRFGLLTIPVGATITNASLELCLDDISGDKSTREYGAHRVTKAWVEDEVTATVASTDVLWDSFFGDSE